MLNPLTPDQAGTLRSFFAANAYSAEGFRNRPMFRELPSRASGTLALLTHLTNTLTSENALLRLFVLGLPFEEASLNTVLPAPVLEAMLASGIVARSGSQIEPQVTLIPSEHVLVASDLLERANSKELPDLVLWPNQTTRILQNFAIRRPTGSTLDLGGGNAVLAIAAAAYSQQVTASDLNARAAAFAAFNASLNGCSLEVVTGDLFEPFQGRSFDRILMNPPFFITPSSGVLYCENPLELDDFCRRVVIEGARHLNEGGYLQIVFEWVQVKGETWQQRLAGWLEGTGCDAWVLRTYEADPAEYAHERTRDRFRVQPQAALLQFHEMLRYYGERGVEQVLGGMLAMRRRSGANWLRIEESRLTPSAPFGEMVIEMFETQDVLSKHLTVPDLLALKPRLAPEARLEMQSKNADGRWVPLSLTLVRPGMLATSLALDPSVAEFVVRADGTRTLESLADQLAAGVNAPLSAVREQCVGIMLKLAERRLILL